jgi:hypothetical protein
MWWNKKRKLERLCDELKSIAMRERLYSDNGKDNSEEEHRARALRQARQSELLAQIERLTSKHEWRSSHEAKPDSTGTPALLVQQESCAGWIGSAEESARSVKERSQKIAPGQSPAAAA